MKGRRIIICVSQEVLDSIQPRCLIEHVCPVATDSIGLLSRMLSAEKINRSGVNSASESRQKFEALEDENRLRQSDGWCRQLFEENPHPMFVYDAASLAILAANAAALREFGFSRAEFLAITLNDICASVDGQAMLESTAPPRGERHDPASVVIAGRTAPCSRRESRLNG